MKKIDVTQPYAMTSPFAEGVYSSVSTSDFEIPADTSTAPDDTCVIDDGFLPITSTDLDDGGIAPERKNFNGMFYLSTDQRFFLQNGGVITYNSNVATAIGGYPEDAILGFIDSQGTYKLVKSLIDDNTNDFTLDETLIDGIHWEEIAMGGGGSGYQMFDIVMKDHVLSYEETLGLAPLGTYVYKEAIAGTRYGYPDYYAKVVAEYQDLNNTTDTVDSVTVTINANEHKFYDIADKATFDNMYAITGEAWYYGIDTTNERIFLPRSTRFKNSTSSDVGEYQPAGLPNITGYIKTSGYDTDGAFYFEDPVTNVGMTTNPLWTQGTYAFDASRSSSIYGASNTVEYASTKLIPYMVVGNTANESSVIDVVDVTTTENDTLPLFTGIYFDYDPNNVSWVIAGGQVVSGTIYEFAYNELVSELTTPKYNLNVIDVDDMVVGTDYSTYWKVDQTNQTFTCPTRTSERVLVAKKEATDADPTWYNLYSDGWCEQGGITAGGTYQSVSLTRSYLDTSYNITAINGTTNTIGSSTNLALYVDQKAINSFRIVNPNTSTIQPDIWQVSGYTAVPDITDYTEPLRMYFKVANAVQNLELLDAGEVLEAVNTVSAKVNNTPHITETYENGKSGYIVYSNGYCEQWGYTVSATVTLLIPYRDTDYNILMTQGPSSAYTAQVANPTTSSFTYGQYQGAYNAYWRTFGYIS